MYLGAKVAWDGILFLLDAEEPNLECDQCVFCCLWRQRRTKIREADPTKRTKMRVCKFWSEANLTKKTHGRQNSCILFPVFLLSVRLPPFGRAVSWPGRGCSGEKSRGKVPGPDSGAQQVPQHSLVRHWRSPLCWSSQLSVNSKQRTRRSIGRGEMFELRYQ